MGAGAEWHVNPGAGTPIQDAVGDTGEGDMIFVHEETNAQRCGCGQAGYAGWGRENGGYENVYVNVGYMDSL